MTATVDKQCRALRDLFRRLVTPLHWQKGVHEPCCFGGCFDGGVRRLIRPAFVIRPIVQHSLETRLGG